jgi:hypothetical protein
MDKWLQDFAYKISINWWVFILGRRRRRAYRINNCKHTINKSSITMINKCKLTKWLHLALRQSGMISFYNAVVKQGVRRLKTNKRTGDANQ